MEDFFENGAVALHIVGQNGAILRANRAELDLLGYHADEYIGRNIADFHADGEVIADILSRLTRGETLSRYPARLRARDGTIRHVEITSSGQFHNGEFVNTRCFTLDVTDLKRTRDEVRRKDDLIRQVLDALPAGVFMTDRAGVITYLNRAARDLAAKEPVIGVDAFDAVFHLFTLEGRRMPLEQRPIYRVLAENRPVWGKEVLVQRLDGSLVPVMPYPTPIRDESGALTGAVNMFVDMSERRRAEEMIRVAVEAAPNGMLLVDETGRMSLVNRAAEQLFGYDRGELDGERIEKLLPARFRAAHAGYHEAYVNAPAVREMGVGRDLFALRKDGTEVPVEIGLSPVSTSRGLMVLAVIVDISQRQRAAERERLLLREMHHRSSNLFAVIDVIVARTVTGDQPVDQARETLQARLRSLARAHQKLAQASWGNFGLHEIIESELTAFACQIEVEGPQASVGPMQVRDLSLALHELTTNATKYGALSVPQGRIRISWSVEDAERRLVRFRWEERNGPAVVAPTRLGFGGLLLRSLFAEARPDFSPEGLSYEVLLAVQDDQAAGTPGDRPV